MILINLLILLIIALSFIYLGIWTILILGAFVILAHIFAGIPSNLAQYRKYHENNE